MSDDTERDLPESRDDIETATEEPQPATDQQDTPSTPKITKRSVWRSVILPRLVRWITSLGVRYKIAGTLILILSLAVLSLGAVTFTRQNTLLRNEMKSRATILAHELANVGKEGLLTKQEMPVYSAITDIQKREGVVYALVTDSGGKVFAHSGLARKGSIPPDASDQSALKSGRLLFKETFFNDEPVLDTALPIVLKSRKLTIGIARIGLSEMALNESISKQQKTFLWIALGFVVAALLVSFALASVITRPLDALADGIQVVARGDLRKLVAVRFDDEIGKLTRMFNQMILSLREKILMEKYLSQSTVLSIKEHRDVTQLKLGGERKYVTALFSDARGFTALSERMTPEDVVRLMNIYLNLQTSVIHHFGGIVDKFVGDEVMAIFEGRGREINAIRAAVEIQNYCATLNAARAASGERQISLGIGVNSGDVVMGNMGSEDHMDYTVIGDNINIAARLCGAAQPGQVLVSKITADEAGDLTTWKDLPPVMVKGKDHPIGIAEAVAVKGGARKYMRKETDAPVTFALEGFPDEIREGTVKNIGPGGCLVQVDGPIAIGSKLNITFNIVALGSITVRAAVYHARKQEKTYYVGLCFENLQLDAKNRIIHWVHQVSSEIAEGLFL